MTVIYENVGLRGGPGSFVDAHEFAASRGWRVCRPFKLKRLGCALERDSDRVLDHVEYFALDGKPHAIVSHTYRHPAGIERFADVMGLRLEYIPYSWHNPESAIGVIFTRAL